MKQIVDLNLAKAREKGIKFIWNCDKAVPKYLVGDCKRLSGIANELTANAFKFTESGAIKINAAVEKKEHREVILKLTISDTGMGIPQDKQKDMFARFSRLTPAYEGKYIGLSLCLSIVKQYVDDMDGEIYVTSEPNKGTTFTCYLPFSIALSADKTGLDENEEYLLPVETYSKEKILKRITPQIPQKATAITIAKPSNVILVVEDDEISALLAKTVLTSLNYKVDVAANGTEALEKLKKNHYGLIFMDIGLPDMSGNEVTRQIRAEEKNTDSHIPINYSFDRAC